MSYHRRKVKGTLHWVSVRHGVKAEVRLYDRRFFKEDSKEDKEVGFKANLNPDSLPVPTDCVLEPSFVVDAVGKHFQGERQGYLYADPVSCIDRKVIFNRTVGLRDTWNKVQGGEVSRCISITVTGERRYRHKGP